MGILTKVSLLINVHCIRKIANICGTKFVGHPPLLAFATLSYSVNIRFALMTKLKALCFAIIAPP